jgi:hypothetical protein
MLIMATMTEGYIVRTNKLLKPTLPIDRLCSFIFERWTRIES